ncbi:MAG: hypothetical protein KDB14_25890 [Planctomycetales bacterium]|nr:hypothetical protein [Planctomycetales bacterium]
MLRYIRIWEKKRGTHSTGSATVGLMGETLFYAVLFLLGSVTLAALLTTSALEPDPRYYTFGYGFYLMVLVLTSFIIIGGVGVAYGVLEVGASVERRGAMARRAASLELLKEARTAPSDLPTVPSDANLTNSPGVELAYRLPRRESPLWQLALPALFCAAWSGVAGALVVIVIDSIRYQRTQWWLLLFTLPFIACGFWAVRYFFRELLIHTMIGPTQVEISELPLYPGGRYEIYLNQSGRLEMDRLDVWLVCVEEATFRQGTDIRTEQHVVRRQPLVQHGPFTIDRGKPFEHRFLLRIPDEAMHTFVARNNSIHWRIEVEGEAKSWPVFHRTFPLIVHPAATS